MSQTPPCWSCGLENAAGRDFCERCGEYLNWAPTGYVAAVPRPAMADAERGGSGVHDMPTSDLDAVPPTEDHPAADQHTQDHPPPAPPDAPPLTELPPAPPQVVGLSEGPPPSGDASIVLWPLDPAVGAAGVPAVDAGSMLTFLATVRNESRIVDNYDLSVVGLPDNWSVVSPAAAFLVPLATGGESEQEVRIDLAPPREYRSTAGIWTFELVAISRATGLVAARQAAQFEVRPFSAWTIDVTPVANSGRLRARYSVAVRNDGNADQQLWLIAFDDAGRLRARFAAGMVALQPGAVGVDTLTLRPRLPRPVGRATEHRVAVDALPTAPEDEEADGLKAKLAGRAREKGAEAKGKAGDKVKGEGKKALASLLRGKKPALPRLRIKKPRLNPASALSRLRSEAGPGRELTGRQVTFRQKPIIPLWLIALVVLAAIAGYVIYTLLPDKVDVPRLVGARDAFTAEKRLRQNGLVLAQPVQRRAAPDAPPGSVVGQSPAAGTRVEKGDTVSLEVAAGSRKIDVPRLAGLNREKADERLRADGLALGETQPTDAPDTFVVRSQIPKAGLAVDRGTAVRVFLRKPPTKKGGDKGKGKEGGGGAGGGGGGGSDKKDIVIPPIDDMPADEYIKALDELKLEPRAARMIAAAPPGTVLEVDPQPGEKAAKGDKVTVRVSDGSPPLAVETEGLVQMLNPVDGEEVGRLPKGEGSAVEPSFLPGGTRVLYRADRQLVLAGTAKETKVQPRMLYRGPDELVSPAVAPNGKAVALIRREEDDGDLCFGRLDRRDIHHLCQPDDGWNLSGRIAWRRDGRVLLVPGRRSDNPAVFGVRMYTTKRRYSTDPEQWSGRVATDVTTPGKGVLSMTFSPGGTRLAAITNLESDRFEVVLAKSEDTELVEPMATGAGACDVAWRPDGKELAIVEGDAMCSEPAGKVLRFSPNSPDKTAKVADEGRNPAYRPVG